MWWNREGGEERWEGGSGSGAGQRGKRDRSSAVRAVKFE